MKGCSKLTGFQLCEEIPVSARVPLFYTPIKNLDIRKIQMTLLLQQPKQGELNVGNVRDRSHPAVFSLPLTQLLLLLLSSVLRGKVPQLKPKPDPTASSSTSKKATVNIVIPYKYCMELSTELYV